MTYNSMKPAEDSATGHDWKCPECDAECWQPEYVPEDYDTGAWHADVECWSCGNVVHVDAFPVLEYVVTQLEVAPDGAKET